MEALEWSGFFLVDFFSDLDFAFFDARDAETDEAGDSEGDEAADERDDVDDDSHELDRRDDLDVVTTTGLCFDE